MDCLRSKPQLVCPWLVLAACLSLHALSASETRRAPNVVWIILDDVSPHFSCYGEKTIQTPHTDRLAQEGTRFANAFVTAPVCSPSRSALITGMYQTTIGAHQHRSGRGTEKIRLPDNIRLVPSLFQGAGYFTCNSGWPIQGKTLGKTDYNFVWDAAIYDGTDWAGRRPGQPFFAQIQLWGGKQRDGKGLSAAVKAALGTRTPAEAVALPPYYPDDPVIRQDWADYLDAIRFTDLQIGQVRQRLESEGILDQTLLVVLGDNGVSTARGKQFLYDEGIRSPLIIRGPGVAANYVRTDLVEHIDVAATSLAFAGIRRPRSMQARDLFAKGYRPRDAVFAARDRCDETVDAIRSVRTARFKYIRNFYPDRPHLQPNLYKDGKPTLRRLRELHQRGELSGLPEQLLFADSRAAEELYDLSADPFETRNLAADPREQSTLLTLRARLDRWMKKTKDPGRRPEPASMFASDMAVYQAERQLPEEKAQLQRNLDLMRRWETERPLRVLP